MIIANILSLKKNEKVEGIDNNNQFLFGKESWIFSKIFGNLAKHIHQLEFENCIFSVFEGEFPLRHPMFSMAKGL